MPDIAKPNYQYLWSSGGSLVAPSNVKVQTGWTAEVPPFQWENWSQNRQDQAIAHILQHGISVWDNVTEYQAGKSYVQGSDGLLYKARTTHTNVNPVTDTSYVNWTPFPGGLLNVRTITSTGTYTPTQGTTSVIVEVIGAGGGSGSTVATGGSTVAVSGGGGGGGYAISRLTTGFSGVVVTIGAGGTGGTIGADNAGAGGTSSFGALLQADGGIGGQGNRPAAPTSSSTIVGGGLSGAAFAGNIMNSPGSPGGAGLQNGLDIQGGQPGLSGRGSRSGGEGLQRGLSQAAAAGLAGVGGRVIIWEYA